jgi:hypothetical protein
MRYKQLHWAQLLDALSCNNTRMTLHNFALHACSQHALESAVDLVHIACSTDTALKLHLYLNLTVHQSGPYLCRGVQQPWQCSQRVG